MSDDVCFFDVATDVATPVSTITLAMGDRLSAVIKVEIKDAEDITYPDLIIALTNFLLRWNRDELRITTPHPSTSPKAFPGQWLLDLYDGEISEVLEHVATTQTGTSRWQSHHNMVFKDFDGKLYMAEFSRGLTKNQDHDMWDPKLSYACPQVQPVEKVIITYATLPTP